MIGSRSPDKPELREWLDGDGEGVRAGAFDDVAGRTWSTRTCPAAPDMFIAGGDDGAKATVTEILGSFGWLVVHDIGGIDGARQLESLCLPWVVVGVKRGAFDHAFKLLTG